MLQKTDTVKDFEYFVHRVAVAFDGTFVDPGQHSIPGEPSPGQALTDPVNPRPAGRNFPGTKGEQRMQATIGTFEKAKDGYRLKIALPFVGRVDCLVSVNREKKKETAPDAKIYYRGNEVGAIWSKTKKEDPNFTYKSGILLCPFLPKAELSFAIFRDENTENAVQRVVADFGSARDSAPAKQDPDFE